MKLRLKRITEQVAPALTAIKGVGPDVTSTLLLAAGDHARDQRRDLTSGVAAAWLVHPDLTGG